MDISSISNLLSERSAAIEAPLPHAEAAQCRELVRAVQAVNRTEFFGQENELTFLMDRQTHKPIARIVNRVTREVVRQIPAEYVIRLAEEYSRG